MGLMSMFPGGGSTNNQPLKAPTNFVATADGQTSIALTWTDPENEYAQPSGVLIGEWMFTRIVRKTGSAPVNANDGILVVESGIKNQYQTTPYVDTGLISGTVYYYAAFAFTKTRVSSPGAQVSYNLKGYDAVLENNTWDMIALACREGDAASVWTKGDTKDLVLTNGYTMTMSLLYLNNTNNNGTINGYYPLTDGTGAPALLFGTKNLYYQTSGYYDRSAYVSQGEIAKAGYFLPTITGIGRPNPNNLLKPFIDGIYNAFPSDIKPYIQQVNLEYNDVDIVDSNTSFTNPGRGSAYIFPFTRDSAGRFYTTTAQRTKRLNNGTGEVSKWRLGDLWNAHDSSYGGSIITSEYVSETGNISRYPGSDDEDSGSLTASRGVCFGFCFEKAVTS